jgi:1-deoxy-D-xylulose-5-phosphate synthase
MVQTAIKVSEIFLSKHQLTSTVINARFAKPIDKELFTKEIPNYKKVIIIEDHALASGFGSGVLEMLSDNQIDTSSILRFGVKDQFTPHASQAEQHQINGYDTDSIVKSLETSLESVIKLNKVA